MHEQKQIVALAEFEGYKWSGSNEDKLRRLRYWTPPGYLTPPGVTDRSKDVYINELPNYPHDLDAVHRLEKLLNSDQQEIYVRNLYAILDIEAETHIYFDFVLVHASAAEKCEAMLLAINKWGK